MTRLSEETEIGPEKAPQEPPAKRGIAAAIAVAVLLGAMAGVVFAWFVARDLMVGSAIGGALIGGALRASLFVFTDKRSFEPEGAEK